MPVGFTELLAQGRDGNFYGTTPVGGTNAHGAVFRMTPGGQVSILYSFTGEKDGEHPLAALIEGQDGNFYGTTSFGGTGFNGPELPGLGTVFRVSPAGVLTTLLYFDGLNGANPQAPLLQAGDGTFYGTTARGGARNSGTVFRLSVSAPSLAISRSTDHIILSWPAWAGDLQLQQNSDLNPGNWTNVTTPPVQSESNNQVILTPTPRGNTFYRLTQ